MKITFLGTGTSVGIPAIGCDCPVCTSLDPRNTRFRTSMYVEAAGKHIVIDTTTDFRTQALAHGLSQVDAVLFTHSHADHIMGFDDIRRFNTIQQSSIPAFGSPETIADLNRVFDYIGQEHEPGVYRPKIDFHKFSGPFSVGDVDIEPMEVTHGSKRTHGFLFRSFGQTLGYFPDCLEMPDDVVTRLKGIDVMVLDALRGRKHSTHLTLEASMEILARIGAGKSFIVHMCHELDHEETEAILPASVFVPWDGQVVEW